MNKIEQEGDNIKVPKPQAGFDYRIVEYEKIHNIRDEYFEALVDAVDPKPGNVVLDGMDGYGSVAKWILKRAEKQGFKPEIFTLDESKAQIDRTRKNIPDIDEQHIIQADIRETGFPNEKFDSVVIKMGVHEVPKEEQEKLFAEIYRILKLGGKFVIWELALDAENQKVFQDIIRKKDELAGFDKLTKNRYFPRHEELKELFEKAGFVDVRDHYEIFYELSIVVRNEELVSKERKQLLEQKGKITEEDEENLRQLGEKKAVELTRYARERIPLNLREKMKYRDLDNDVKFQVMKIIMGGFKK